MEIHEQGKILKVTVSIGGVIIDSHEVLEPKSIFRKADSALYYSKEHGRNKSTVFKLGLLDLAKMRNQDYDFAESDEA